MYLNVCRVVTYPVQIHSILSAFNHDQSSARARSHQCPTASVHDTCASKSYNVAWWHCWASEHVLAVEHEMRSRWDKGGGKGQATGRMDRRAARQRRRERYLIKGRGVKQESEKGKRAC